MAGIERVYRANRDWVARSLLIALAGVACVCLCTATIGAAIWPIPIIGLVGLLLMPFPTLLIYLCFTLIVYFVVMVPLRWCDVERGWHRWAALAVGIVVTGLAGTFYPEAANRQAGVADATPSPGWAPLQLGSRQVIALVLVQKQQSDPKCNSFCLSLLVTGRANEVIVTGKVPRIHRGVRVSGTAFGLTPTWRECFRKLPDYSFVVRQYPKDRLAQFIESGLDPDFSNRLPRCLIQRTVQFAVGAVATLVMWQGDKSKEDPRRGEIGWQSPYAEQGIFLLSGSDTNRRPVRFGNRYVVPAMIWPYGGNAGSGGSFSPALMKVFLSTDSVSRLDGPSWWDMVANTKQLALQAMANLDATVSDRLCLRDPDPQFCGTKKSESSDIFDNSVTSP